MHLYIKKLLVITCLGISLFSNAQGSYLQWGKDLGSGVGDDFGVSIVTDKLGNSYTCGDFRDTVDFDSGIGVHKLYSYFGSFILKSDASGNFIWAKPFDYSHVTAITLDSLGNLYAIGFFSGIRDFDPGIGMMNLNAATGNLFVVKLDSFGNFVWAKNIGSNNSVNGGYSIAIDLMQDIYIMAAFSGIGDFDPGPGIYNLTSASSSDPDVFICKLNSNGNFIWATAPPIQYHVYSGQGKRLAIDRNNDVNIIASNSMGMIISKLDTAGNFIWTKSINGTGLAQPNGVSIDSLKQIYVTGRYFGTVDFDPGSGVFDLTSNYSPQYPLTSYHSIFVAKYDSLGNFVWAKNILNGWTNSGNDITVDAVGNSYTTGSFRGTIDFDPGPGYSPLTSGSDDVFILRLDPNGNLVWAGNYASGGIGLSITCDKQENIYTTGYTYGKNIFIRKVGQGPVGIIENHFANNIFIYPNPANNFFNIKLNYEEYIELNNVSIELSNSLGQVVFKENIISQNAEINIKSLINGLYFLKIISDNKVVATKKIIKE